MIKVQNRKPPKSSSTTQLVVTLTRSPTETNTIIVRPKVVLVAATSIINERDAVAAQIVVVPATMRIVSVLATARLWRQHAHLYARRAIQYREKSQRQTRRRELR